MNTNGFPIYFRTRNRLEKRQETFATEIRLALCINDEPPQFCTCSPENIRQLIAGRLRIEKKINEINDIVGLQINEKTKQTNKKNDECVYAQVELKSQQYKPNEQNPKDICIQGKLLFACVQNLEKKQHIFQKTGCMHATGLFDKQGKMLAIAEDVARRSAFEKAVGQALETGTLNKSVIAVTTSRLNAELVRCANAVGILFLCGISVGTFSALQTAKNCGITLVGKVRGENMNIYTGHERLLWEN